MKYYIYISESKLSMILRDIPKKVKLKFSSKTKFNIGLLSSEVNIEEISEDDRKIRVQFVEDFILKNSKIGPCYNPKSWIKEDNLGLKIIKPHGLINENSTLFVKKLNDHTLFILGGSTMNLTGNVNLESVVSSYSYTERVLDSLECLIRNNDALKYKDEHKELVEGELNGATTSDWNLMPLFNIISQLEDDANTPEQRVSFLAKKLVVSNYENKTIIIGSSLYVALYEE